MLPRNAADYRTLVWVLIAPVLVAAQFYDPTLVPYLSWLSCYFALACGVIAHNHNHCQTFTDKRANNLFGMWLSLFYGYPTFAWVPTHNLNHHKYVNTEGDATITWRFTNRHTLWVALSYFFVSSYYQSEPINAYIKNAKVKNPALYRRILTQYAVWIGAYVAAMGLAISLHGLTTGAYVWFFALGLPALFALWTIMLFNYDQHAHTDPFSEHDHSRSFVSPVLNYLLFNNGYHAAHHEHPGVHWTRLPQLHAAVSDKMHPELVQQSLWWYWCKQYFLSPLVPSLGTTQIGPGPMNPPGIPKKSRSGSPAENVVSDAGTNAERLEFEATA
jgi:beta-carotene hydroxylase